MFWPCFFGVFLVALAIAGPRLAHTLMKRRNATPLRKRAACLLSMAPGAYLLTCFAISEGRQMLLVSRMERIERGWSSSQVTLLLGPPDHVFQPGELQRGESFGPTNRSVVWSYTPPRDRGLLLVTREFPFIRFRSSLDGLPDILVGGIFGLRQGAFILQLGSDGTVIRKSSWE